jgi:hypothetical protein
MRVNNLVDSRHHGEYGRVRDDGRRDLGLGQGDGQTLAVKRGSALGNDDLKNTQLGIFKR